MLHEHPQVHVPLAKSAPGIPCPHPRHINSGLVNMQLSASHWLPLPFWKPSHVAVFIQHRPCVSRILASSIYSVVLMSSSLGGVGLS